MGYYPIFVELSGRRCIVVGGGNVAVGKVRGLLSADATVTVISPDLHPDLAALKAQGEIEHIEREYRAGDVDSFDLVMVATDDGAVNSEVAAHARTRKIWVNASDDIPNCDFILPSVVRKGKIVVACSTGGASPALARRLREDLDAYLTEDYPALADLLAEVRGELRAKKIVVDADTWQHAIDGQLRALLGQRRYGQAKAYLLRGLGLLVEPSGVTSPHLAPVPTAVGS